jgi:hypothetical protein
LRSSAPGSASPFWFRARLAFDGELLGAVGRVFVDSVLAFYRRTMRDTFVAGTGQSAVTVVQRCSSDLRLNPHFHTLTLDGVFVPTDGDGTLQFHRLPSLSNADVAELLHSAVVRVLVSLERRGVVESRAEPALLDDGSAEREPALAALANASAAGLAPADPERRQRPALALRADIGPHIVSGLSASQAGFSLHAATTTAAADDDAGREALCKYVLRPPIAQERVRLLDDACAS